MKRQDILDENTNRTKGVDALTSNIEAAKAVSEIIKTTLGPMGMDKMLIDSLGNTTITNDGVKILKEMEIEHPGAKMIVEVAKTQEIEVGDGTTTSVIYSGELLSQAQELLKKKIHPTNIVRYFKISSKKALEIIFERGVDVNPENKKLIIDIVKSATTGKIAEGSYEKIAELVYDAMIHLKDENGISMKNIKIIKSVGGESTDSKLIKGIILDKDLANSNMPKKISDAKILLIDFPLEVRELETDARVNLNSFNDYEEFLKSEREYLISIVSKIKSIGANVVICQKGIDETVAYHLAKEGIIGIRRTRKSDIEKLNLALNVSTVSNIEDLSYDNLGIANNVSVSKILDENYIYIQGCVNPKAITLHLKGSTPYFLDEIERAIEDVIGDVSSIMRSKKILGGGGAIELELYKELMSYAKSFAGKEQLIIEAYARSFLSVPRILLENSGFDEIDNMAKLISEHENGLKVSGINSFKGIVPDTIREGIIEPINVKEQAIKSAVETVSLILRIDDIIAAKRISNSDFNLDSDI